MGNDTHMPDAGARAGIGTGSWFSPLNRAQRKEATAWRFMGDFLHACVFGILELLRDVADALRDLWPATWKLALALMVIALAPITVPFFGGFAWLAQRLRR